MVYFARCHDGNRDYKYVQIILKYAKENETEKFEKEDENFLYAKSKKI